MNKLILGLLLVWGLVGCAGVPVSEYPPSYTGGVSEYTIGVGDELRVNVWKNTELSMTVPVRPDGKISLPLVGDVGAQGLTAQQLSTTIADALKNYLRNPQVNVIVTNAGSDDYLLRVRVTGAVNNPISLPHKDGMTVLDLVLEAGGLTPYASANRAKLYRKVGDEVRVYPIRLGHILNRGELSTNYPLLPSDIVTVPERRF